MFGWFCLLLWVCRLALQSICRCWGWRFTQFVDFTTLATLPVVELRRCVAAEAFISSVVSKAGIVRLASWFSLLLVAELCSFVFAVALMFTCVKLWLVLFYGLLLLICHIAGCSIGSHIFGVPWLRSFAAPVLRGITTQLRGSFVVPLLLDWTFAGFSQQLS